jgi:hypothetical protein
MAGAIMILASMADGRLSSGSSSHDEAGAVGSVALL